MIGLSKSAKPATSTSSVLSNKESIFLVGLFTLAIVLRQFIHVRLFPDSIEYLSFAQNILSGSHNIGGITLARFRRPPLYADFIALFSVGNSMPQYLAEVARQISVFAGALVLFPLYFLCRRMMGKIAAAVTIFLAAITPEFLYYSGTVLTESLATLITFIGIYLLWISAQMIITGGMNEEKKIQLLSFFLGSILGFAFLTRHLMIGFVAIGVLWMIASWFQYWLKNRGRPSLPKRLILPVLFVLTGFFITISPQIIYLHAQSGKWALAVDPMSISAENIIQAGDDTRYTEGYESESALSENMDFYKWEIAESNSLFSLMVKQPIRYLSAYGATLSGGYLPDTYPLPYPPIIIILAVLGMIGLTWKRKFRALLFCLWGFGGYYLFLALFLNLRDRYMFPVYPFLLCLSGFGVTTIVAVLEKSIHSDSFKRFMRRVALVIMFCAILLFTIPASISLIKTQNAMANTMVLELLGSKISQRIEKPAIIFDRTPHLAFFSGGVAVTPPYAEISDVVRFARKRGVTYWIISNSYVPRLRPQFAPLLNPYNEHDGLEPVAVYRNDNNFLVIVYKILPG